MARPKQIQFKKFKQAARELETDDSEKRFNETPPAPLKKEKKSK